MTTFPLQVIAADDVLVNYNARYKSSPLARKFAGQPKGAYIGFIPDVSGDPILSLDVDPTEGYSVVKLPSQADPAGVDVVVTSSVTLDFTGQPAMDFPIHVIARASYTDDADTPTTAEIITRSATSIAFDEVLICVVNGPVGSMTIDSDASLGERSEPAGSVEDLQAATDIVNEVVAARIGLDGTVHTDLATRLAADQSAESMAGRLGLVSRVLRSNDYSIGAGDETLNVSGSFTEVDRDHAPFVSLEGTGSETQAGAVAAPNDNVRNVALIQDATSGYRPIDDPIDRRVVFGKIDGPTETTIAGTWTFQQASRGVLGVDGSATTEVTVGDIIQGVDGIFYEVSDVVSDNELELTNAYRGGVSDTADGRILRRWLLRLFKIDPNTNQEVEASLPTPATIRFFFPAFLSIERSNFDYTAAMHTALEREPLPVATTTVPGRLQLAIAGGTLGGIRAQVTGSPVGTPPNDVFHTINFSSPNASVIPSPGTPGEVTVIEIGVQGPTGPSGVSGGTGPTGPTGAGFVSGAINTFEVESEFNSNAGGFPTFSNSFTQDMGHSIHVLTGGIASWRDAANFDTPDKIFITDIFVVGGIGGNIGQLDWDQAGDTFGRVFMSSAGS